MRKRSMSIIIISALSVSLMLGLSACGTKPAADSTAADTSVDGSAAVDDAAADDTSVDSAAADNSADNSAAADNAAADDTSVDSAAADSTAADSAPAAYTYTLESSHEVDGRQGIAWENGLYYVSGSTTLSVYDADWNRIQTETEPFGAFDAEVNHIGDIDVYDGEIYAGVEYFMDGEASNIQMAVYDAETLQLTRTYMFDPESGQTEVSGMTVDPDHGSMWMCSWAMDDSGSYLYRYDLESGAYLGKVRMEIPPQLIQGIKYYDGWLYITADDGDADDDASDHVYKCQVDLSLDQYPVLLEKSLDDVTRQGEIEGLSFDTDRKQLLVCYNRGAIIVKGMPKGFYEGYDAEIHEVFAYDMQ